MTTDAPTEEAPLPDLPLHMLKMAVLRAHQVLNLYYDKIIKAGGATQERVDKHLPALLAAAEKLDLADQGIDIRPNLLQKKAA